MLAFKILPSTLKSNLVQERIAGEGKRSPCEWARMPAVCACVMLVWAGLQRMGHVHAWDGLRNVMARLTQAPGI